MDKAKLPPAPAWVRLAATIIRRLPAGRYRAINWVCPRPPSAFWMRMPGKLGGSVFKCDLRDSIAREVCFTGRYEPQETALVRAILQPGMSFVDVGANWGYFTLVAAHLVGKRGRVVSLEPDPRLFAVLQETVTRNELGQVTPLQVAAADAQGMLTLAGYDETGGNFGVSRIVNNPGTQGGSFRVHSDSLDHILDEQNLDSIDLMKMDIEGAEALAIAGFGKCLTKKRVKRLLLELHPGQLPEFGCSAAAIIQSLQGAAYLPFTIDHSPGATRNAAYSKVENVRTLLRPFSFENRLDAWPHQLWVAPGVELK